jgi:two-component system chemotaxis response regulator CheY
MSEQITNLRILIVDGDLKMRTLTRDMLNTLGILQVYTVGDGSRAYSELRERPFDIVLTERRMDPVTGIDLTRMIRTGADSPSPHIPILMMTAMPSLSDVTEARDAGVTEFLIKPFSVDGLKKRIIATVRNPREFIEVSDYFGPDRRRTVKNFTGIDMRRRRKD